MTEILVPVPAINLYRDGLRKELEMEHYIERRFTSAKEDGGYAPDIARGYSTLLRDREPVIRDLLKLPNVLVLAEPGAGKSTVTKSASAELLARQDVLPVRVSLLECAERRSIAALINASLAELTAVVDLPKRYYILDGLDEVPRELLDTAVDQIEHLLIDENTAGILVTARQAFYVANRDRMPEFHSVFHLLDFSNRDINAYVKSRGVAVEAFLEETKRLSFFAEMRNPFNLKHAVDMYKKTRRLPATRSDLLEFIVRSLLQTRPEISGYRQQRALEQIAVAMEIYAHNELTEEEATQVIRQSIRGMNQTAALMLLDTLYGTILKRTQGGLAFQLASYGEYLAAQSLALEPLSRFRDVACDANGSPNFSWSNTVSYLAELNVEVRDFFCNWHPLWMMNVSPAALSDAQKDAVVTATLELLGKEKMLLTDHPRVRGVRLAQLLTAKKSQDLLNLLESKDEVALGNALSLLGMAGVTETIPVALDIVVDRQKTISLRYAGVLALLNTRASQVVPDLISFLRVDDPLHLHIVDALGTVASLDQFPDVLPILLTSSGMPSSAYYRFQELTSHEAACTLLRYVIEHINQVNSHRAKIYFEPAFEAIAEHFDGELAELCAELLYLIECNNVYLDDSGPLKNLFAMFQHLGAEQREMFLHAFFRRFLSGPIAAGSVLFYAGRFVAACMTMDFARWLAEQDAPAVICNLVLRLDGDVREYLAPFSNGVVAQQDAAREQTLREETDRKTQTKNRVVALQLSLVSRLVFNEALADFHELGKDHWPPIDNVFRTRLTEQVSTRLLELDLRNRIRWVENSVTFPWELNLLLQLTAFYDLEVTSDHPLILSLIYWNTDAVEHYFKRHAISHEAMGCVLELLAEPPYPPVREHLVRFVGKLNPVPPEVSDLLRAITVDPKDLGYSQILACQLIVEGSTDDWLLQRVATASRSEIREIAEAELIRRQHQPTIEERLRRALKDPSALEGDSAFSRFDEPAWISKIVAPFAWNMLVALRERALRLELPGVVSQCSEQLLQIDRPKGVSVLKEQLQFAPQSWRVRQKSIILEQDSLVAVEAARSSPFMSVLTKLRFSTSSNRLKVWCEGINDEEIFLRLIDQLSDMPINFTVDNVHGWSGLQQETDPNVWLAQCNEAVIVMDADNGRKLNKKDKPFTDMAKREQAKLRGYPITFLVLKRYGIENYFTQPAMEAVLRQDLSAFFPIPHDVSIQNHFTTEKKTLVWMVRNAAARVFRLQPPALSSIYPKGKNREVAKHLNARDLEGSDLHEVLLQIVQRAKRLQGDEAH